MTRTLPVFVMLTLAISSASAQAPNEARLLRFPAIHNDTIVFVSAGNLYTVPSAGGIARRLTTHEGFEMFPRFSPDGKWVAFTGQYDGNTEVYVLPSEGGTPKRLTYTATLGRDDVSDRMGPNNIVMGWTPDGKNVLFRSRMRSFNDFLGQLYTVPATGGLAEPLPLPRGGFASYSPDGSKLVYNRIFREFRTWKRYRGGMADDIWTYDFATKKTEQLLANPASDIIPMWASNNKIYFLSDRDSNVRMNLFSMDLGTKQTKQVTDFKEYDCKFPSLGNKAITFENGGYIYTLDLATDTTKKVSIRILEDGAMARGGLKDVSKAINSFDVSNDGKRALFTARGDIFSVPQGTGITKNHTKTPGVHERDAELSPDGKRMAYISDVSGEDEIYVAPTDGSTPAVALTQNSDTYKYSLQWSPDGKKIAWGDKKLRLQYVDVDTKAVTLVNQADAFEITDSTWAPDSKWMAFSRRETGTLTKLYLYSLEQKKLVEVTNGFFASYNPSFGPEGKYLYFASDRDFNPRISQTEWNYGYSDMTKLFVVLLANDTENPFKAKLDDEVEKKEEKKDDKKDEKKPEGVVCKVDIDGIADRVLGIPTNSGFYRYVAGGHGGVYYIRGSTREAGSTFAFYDIANRKEVSCGTVNAYAISPDRKKFLFEINGNYGIADAPKGPVTITNMNMSGVEVNLDRNAEWNQIFVECWRQMRDFFYDPSMHGTDWAAIRKKYEVLVPHVKTRADLTYIIGEMIGELNAGHAYVGGGDLPEVKRIPQGLLGAEFSRDAATGFFKIEKILKGASWSPSLRSPLAEVGLNVKVGDYVVAINGTPVNTTPNLFEHLVNTVGKPVKISLNAQPKLDGARTVVVTPTGDESSLYYHAWVQGNMDKVSKATDGKVGYLHVPDMLTNGLNEFFKNYYPQLGKKALIIDMRGNGGGNVSPILIERLRREIAMVGIARNTAPNVDPAGTFNGPMCCLLNEFSASDGDLFPYRFKHYKMGPLIGKRSWGGVIGIRGTLPLLDGGVLNKPEFSRYDIEGKKWIIEGYGVDPDPGFEVQNDPADEYSGKDAQLNKAIEEMLKKLKEGGEKTLPAAPPYPKK